MTDIPHPKPSVTIEDKIRIANLRDALIRVIRENNFSPAVSLTALCHVIGMVIGQTRQKDPDAARGMVAVATNMIPRYADAYTKDENPLVM